MAVPAVTPNTSAFANTVAAASGPTVGNISDTERAAIIAQFLNESGVQTPGSGNVTQLRDAIQSYFGQPDNPSGPDGAGVPSRGLDHK
ncbi:hypothetical protein FGB62_136g012 [Gracilaria domingensis]|nr:hypothetical protein FGB62_136g012 [Gracilaria domingensis]